MYCKQHPGWEPLLCMLAKQRIVSWSSVSRAQIPLRKARKLSVVATCFVSRHLKALMFLYAFEESVDCHLLSSFCDDSNLHISLFKYALSTMGVNKESISKLLIGNRFHVKLRILSPENCKQSLQVKSWKAEVTAEKKQTQNYNRNFVIQAPTLILT